MPALGRVARLLRRVVAYGRDLMIAVRVRATTPDFPRIARPFGTSDLNTILARIAAAISRATMLERELRYRATCEQAGVDPDAAPPSRSLAMPAHAPADAPACDGPSRPESEATQRGSRQRKDNSRPPDGLPTIKQIAAELRRLPVGVVIANICRELGITSEHPLWPELSEVITAYGGSTTELRRDEATRWCSKRWLDWPFPRTLLDVPMAVWPLLMAPCPYEAATGPP